MSEGRYVYFIKPIGMDGPIKIGCSSAPRDRLITFSVWSPFPLELIGTAPGDSKEESRLHKRFAKLHTHREWFQASPLLRQTIERILAGETIKAACTDIPVTGEIRNQKKKCPSPERQRCLAYGKRIRDANKGEPLDKNGRYRAPLDVQKIIDAWYEHVTPTEVQIQRLEEYLSDPVRHGVFVQWGSQGGSWYQVLERAEAERAAA